MKQSQALDIVKEKLINKAINEYSHEEELAKFILGEPSLDEDKFAEALESRKERVGAEKYSEMDLDSLAKSIFVFSYMPTYKTVSQYSQGEWFGFLHENRNKVDELAERYNKTKQEVRDYLDAVEDFIENHVKD